MLRSPSTRRGKGREGNKSCGVRVRYRGERWWVLYAFVTRNLGKDISKKPKGVKISSENKSAEGEGTGRMEVDAMRKGWTKKATHGRLCGGWKHFQEENEGRLPFLTGGSCKTTIIGGVGRVERLLMSERNTSQLPRLLCCTMDSERETPPAGDGGGDQRVCLISGPGPSCQVGQERGWGPPGGAGRRHLE